MKKVYIYNEQEIFMNEYLSAGFSHDEALKEVGKIETNMYEVILEKKGSTTHHKLYKNNEKIKCSELTGFERGYYWNPSIHDFMKLTGEIPA